MIDEGVGRVLDELVAECERDNTLIVYTSDHGLNLGHHGIWGKGNGSESINMLEESIRVPLKLNYPGLIDGGQERAEFVTHCDLHRTLLDFAKVEPKRVLLSPGRSYFQGINALAGDFDWRQYCYAEYGPVCMFRAERFKLVRRYEDAPDLLHDLVFDPRETVNHFYDPAFAAIVTRLQSRLEGFLRAFQ